MGDGEGHGNGDCSVDGIAASLKSGDAGVSGVGFAGDHHGLAGVDGLPGVEGRRDEHQGSEAEGCESETLTQHI